MLKRLFLSICTVVILFSLFQCGTQMQMKIPGATYPGALKFEELKRNEYEVLGEVKGQGKASYTGLWPIPVFWFSVSDEKYGNVTNLKLWSSFGIGEVNIAKEIAVYKALESIPDADLIIEPRYRVVKKSWAIWHSKAAVEVKGKAIKIKTDKEIKH